MGAPKKTGKALPTRDRRRLQEKALKNAVDIFSKDAGKARPVHLSDLAAELVRAFKGPRGLALRAYLQYLKTDEGSATRTKILDMVFKMVIADSNHSQTGGTDVDDLSDQELEQELHSVMSDGVAADPGDPFTEADKEALEEAAKAEELTDPEVAAMEEEIQLLEEAGDKHDGYDKSMARLMKSLEGAQPIEEDDEAEGGDDEADEEDRF